MKTQPALTDKRTIALRAAIARCRAAIARCRDLMRSAKRRGDMETYRSYLKQLYGFKQQLRGIQRILTEQTQ